MVKIPRFPDNGFDDEHGHREEGFTLIELLIIIVLTVIGVIVLVAAVNSDQPVEKTTIESYKQISLGVFDKNLRDVRLPDGTRCIIYEGYQKGGISCDFSKGE